MTIHIGHLAGVYVPSDIYVRYLRSIDKDVIYICGSDEHGVAISIKFSSFQSSTVYDFKFDIISSLTVSLSSLSNLKSIFLYFFTPDRLDFKNTSNFLDKIVVEFKAAFILNLMNMLN